MNDFEYYTNLDSHPFTGIRSLTHPLKARVDGSEHIKKFFDGTPDYNQVENVTIGKVYEIYAVEGYGDGADFFFKDDTGKERRLGSFFFLDASAQE